MITEDYCSYEVAKLLKEKGFDEYCWKLYELGDGDIPVLLNGFELSKESSFWNNKYLELYKKEHCYINDICSAPTHQMAMKWLREVHNKHCDIGYDIDLGWFFQIIDLKETVEYDYPETKYYHTENETGFNTYEEAVEAALKYCIENLI